MHGATRHALNGEPRLPCAQDFGACAYVSETRAASEPVGTPIYMAPEVAAAKGYGPSADVWAFGCTMFEVLSLSPPVRIAVQAPHAGPQPCPSAARTLSHAPQPHAPAAMPLSRTHP